jgi:hypothetical protein
MGTGKQNAKARTKAIRKYCFFCSGDQSFEVIKCQVFTCPLYPFRKSVVDRSLELNSTTENGHIAPISEMAVG